MSDAPHDGDNIDPKLLMKHIMSRPDWKQPHSALPPSDTVTRIVVVDDTGRVYEKWNVKVELSYQDQGHTLKVFVSEEGVKH